MRPSIKTLFGLFASVLLASCGGGGGSSDDSAFNPPGVIVSMTVQAATTPASLIPVTVRVTGPNGAPLADGTVVNLVVSPAGIGFVSGAGAPGAPIVLGATASSTTIGGIATFRFHSRAVGAATLTASVPDPNAPARSVTATAIVTVQGGASSDPRITLEATRTTLPPNTLGVPPFYGSPFISDVTVTCRRLDGTLVPDGTVLGVSVTPFQDLSNGFSTPDLGSTPNIDEFVQILNTGPVTLTGGRATIFVHSARTLASFNLTVTCVDPSTGETVSSTLQFNTQQISLPLPASIAVTPVGPVYIQGSGGQTTGLVTAIITDASGQFVPDPAAGVNNVRFEIVGGAQAGERLSGASAGGAAVSGGSIDVRTSNGVATVSFQSGTRQGPVQIRVTSDRADNNVSNGIQDPISTVTTIRVSDGRLFDLELTVPTLGAIVVNSRLGEDDEGIVIELPDGTELTIPIAPDGTYTLTVSAIGTDRQGNPPIPGTQINFGLIDFPLVNNFFAIAGNDGDPQEGGTFFSAPTGAFRTAGGGAGPGDTLIVFGEDSPGNRDLESARTISSVTSQTSLTVQYRFNFNDDTGVSVNNGPVLPYVIGRATSANITASALTNDVGVATVDLTYPVTQLGRQAVVWAQGTGDVVSGTAELVTDAEFMVYPGVAPATLTALPSIIPGNRTVDVNVCITDALGAGIRGITVAFGFQNLFGTGSVDGQPGNGFVTPPTGSDGCTIATVTTSGVTPPAQGGDPARVVFSAGGLSDSVDIVVGQLILTANPNAVVGDGTRTITLTLLEGNGTPVSGVLLTGTCQASSGGTLTIVVPPGVTDANGVTTARVNASGFFTTGTTPPTGSCTFTTPTGSPTAVVTWTGFDQCSVNVSPPPENCPVD